MESKLNFEAMLLRLEEIINLMEARTLPLEESISLYEEGTKILNALENRLSIAETKITEISKEKAK